MRVLEPVNRAVGAALAAGTALRGARIFHPDGVAHTARLTVTPTQRWGARLLDEATTYDAVVRLSRGVGLPPSGPDLLGLAVRIPTLDQDLLFTTAGSRPVLRHLFAPLSTTYSTVLPFRAGTHTVVLAARPDRPVRTYAALAAAAEGLAFRLFVAEPLGPWNDWGRLVVGTRLAPQVSRELRFDPWHDGGGLVPVGWLQGLRGRAYRESQAARE